MRRRTDRVLLTNWDSQVGRICVGDVEVELEPGQSAAVWIDRADPGPCVADEPAARPRESLVLFTDGVETII